jgi:hypothetical protein
VDPHRPNPEDFGPHHGERLFQRRAGRNERGSHGRRCRLASLNAELFRHAVPLQLTRWTLRKSVDKEDARRHFEVRELRPDKLAQFPLRTRNPWAQDDCRRHVVAQRFVRQPKRDRLRHRRVIQQDVVDFTRADLFAAAIDRLLQSIRDEQVTVLVEVSRIAGSQPAIGKGMLSESEQFSFRALPGRDIPDKTCVLPRARALPGDHGQLELKLAPVFAQPLHFDDLSRVVRRCGGRTRPVHSGLMTLPVAFGHQQRDGLTQQFFFSVAKKAFCLGIDRFHRAGLVDGDDAVKGAAHDGYGPLVFADDAALQRVDHHPPEDRRQDHDQQKRVHARDDRFACVRRDHHR